MNTGDQVSLLVAFGAGIVSFLAPCTLPLVPVYATYLLGTAERRGGGSRRGWLLIGALGFSLGFTAVFLTLGLSASLLGQIMLMNRTLLRRIAGALIFVFGAHLAGVFKIRWLESQIALNLPGTAAGSRAGTIAGHLARSLLLGVAFSAGWHPCIGPVLGAILAYAGTTGAVSSGLRLLLVYSLGMAVPFVLLALFFERFRPLVSFLQRHSALVARVTGVVLMLMGLAVFLDLLVYLTRLAPVFTT